MTSFMKLHELLSHPFVLSLELLCEKKVHNIDNIAKKAIHSLYIYLVRQTK